MFRTFLAIQRVNLGFDPRGLLTFQLLGNIGNSPQEAATFKRQLREQLAAIPGVQSVTASFPLPLAGGFSPVRWGGAEAQGDPSKFQAADLQIVLPGYFEAMGTRLIDGRTFTQEDSTPDRNLLIVDQALAAKAFPNESAVGKRILFRVRTPEAQWGEIIGVVAHQRNTSLIEPGREQLYVTDGYVNHQAASWWALRTDGDPAALASAVREVVKRVGPETFINEMQPMDSLVVQAQAQTRFSLLLIGVFSAIAALLAKGWTVAAPDYPGLGTPSAHPYLIGASAARSMQTSLPPCSAARARRPTPGGRAPAPRGPPSPRGPRGPGTARGPRWGSGC